MSRRFAPLVIVLLVLGVAVAFILATVNRDQKLSIGTSGEGSASYVLAQVLAGGLERRGFDVEIVATDQTLGLIDMLADPDNPVDVTFVQEKLDAARYPTVTTLGTIARVPYLLITWPGSHDLDSIEQMRGARIDIGPVGSNRAAFMTQVLGQFGVTAENSTFLNLPTRPTPAEIAAARPQVTGTILDSRSEYLLGGVASGELELVGIPQSRALADRIPSAEAVEVPVGAVSLLPSVPAEAVPTVAQLSAVVADERLSPAAAYAIAQELVRIFSPGDAWSEPGEFPNFADRQLPVNPSAAEYYATGSIPWQYEHLLPVLADSFVSLLILGTLILLAASVWSIMLPEAYSLWTGVLRPRAEDRFLSRMEARRAEGLPLSARDQQRLALLLRKHESEDLLRARAHSLREQVGDQPVAR